MYASFPASDRFSRVRRLDFTTVPKATVRFFARCLRKQPSPPVFFRNGRRNWSSGSPQSGPGRKGSVSFHTENDAVETPFEYETAIAKVLAPYRERRTKDRLVVPGWEPPTSRNRRDTATTLVELNKRLHECIGYERREEGAALSPAETLRLGRGACRDVTVFAGGDLRQMGFAARLASGYLRESDAETRRAEGSLHAWTEVSCRAQDGLVSTRPMVFSAIIISLGPQSA